MTPYAEQLAGVCAADPQLCGPVPALRNLEAILKWAETPGGIDSVQMDEYSYDILVPYAGRWLAFGVT